MSNLDDLKALCTDAGDASIKYIEFIPTESIEKMVVLVDESQRNLGTLKLKDDADWLSANFIPRRNKPELQVNVAPTENNESFKVSIQAAYPSASGTEREPLLQLMTRFRWVVRVYNADGDIQVFGTKMQPLAFSYNQVRTHSLKSFSGFNINFTGDQSTAPYFID